MAAQSVMTVSGLVVRALLWHQHSVLAQKTEHRMETQSNAHLSQLFAQLMVDCGI